MSNNVKVEFVKGELYEIEVYVAKKRINLSVLYEKLCTLLNDPASYINGYSLYEVEGDWRAKLNLTKGNRKDFKTLKALKNKKAFKDLIRPIVKEGKNKFAIFDESSIVLKIMVKSTKKIDWKKDDNHVIREIKEIFRDITKSEKSIFFTIKKLKKAGSIKR